MAPAREPMFAGLRADFRNAPGGPWRLAIFFALHLLLAPIIFLVEVPKLEGDIDLLLVLLILNAAAELAPVGVYGTSYTSVDYVLTVALVILFGPPAVILSAPIVAIAGKVGRRRMDYKLVTNACRFIVVNWVVALTFEAIAGHRPAEIDGLVVIGVAVATVVHYCLIIGLVSISTNLRTGESVHEVFGQHTWIAPQQAVLAIMGIGLTAVVQSSLGIIGVLTILAPVVMTRFAIKQYTDKTRENVVKLTSQNVTLQKANVEITRVGEELRQSYDGTLEALVNALDARDQETKGHSVRVSRYMMDIAQQIGVVEGTKQWTDMQRGSLLHDVGKIGVSDTILLKPSKLTDEEWAIMRRHPEIGYNMLRQVKFLEGAAEIILAHHERWDGKGYPYGLHEDEIPLGARIFTVVDTFDSMTSDRPYRKALSTMDALNEILKNGGTQFDPIVVEAFLDIYATWAKERDQLHEITPVRPAA